MGEPLGAPFMDAGGLNVVVPPASSFDFLPAAVDTPAGKGAPAGPAERSPHMGVSVVLYSIGRTMDTNTSELGSPVIGVRLAITNKDGNFFRVGNFLDFGRLATRAEGPHGAHVRSPKRNRIHRRSRLILPKKKNALSGLLPTTSAGPRSRATRGCR